MREIVISQSNAEFFESCGIPVKPESIVPDDDPRVAAQSAAGRYTMRQPINQDTLQTAIDLMDSLPEFCYCEVSVTRKGSRFQPEFELHIQGHSRADVSAIFNSLPAIIDWQMEYCSKCNWFQWHADLAGIRLLVYGCRERWDGTRLEDPQA